jgi:DNA-binding MarR family transcriptional regulator
MFQPDFVQIPTQLLLDTDLHVFDRIVYGYIYWMEQLKDGVCTASNETLAELAQTTPRNVVKGLERLEAKGYIRRVFSQDNSNHRVKIEALVSFRKATSIGTPPTSSRTPPHVQPDAQVKALSKSSVESSNKLTNNSTLQKEELLAVLNKLTGRSFRVLPHGSAKTLQAFTIDEICLALTMLKQDPWHKPKLKDLKPDYLLRSTTIDRFLNKFRDLQENEGREDWMTDEWLEDQKKAELFRQGKWHPTDEAAE